MSWKQFAWSAAYNTFAIIVVLSLYAKFTEPFETAVISLIGLLYTTIVGQHLHVLLTMTGVALAIDKQFLELQRLIDPESAVERSKAIRDVEHRMTDKTLFPIFVAGVS
jgi:hypothetical protein